ncbi:MAG: lipid II flippase MurJ, partial [bacterium]|nr:lipid II flippase MurJ [bacterium]
RDRLMLAKFAASETLLQSYDAFRVAFQVPDLIYQLVILGALSASFVPIFTVLKKKSQEEAFKMVNVAMNWLLLFFIFVSILVIIFAPQITHWRIGEAYTAEQINIVINLTRIMMAAQLFFAVSSFFSGMLQSYQRFIVPALVPLLYNGGIVIGTYIFFPYFGIYAAGIGVVLGAFLHMLLQLPFITKLDWHYRFIWDTKTPGVKKLFSMMPARALTLGMSEVQNFGLSYFVTSIAGIGYTIIVLARNLVIMPIRFIGVPIGQASLPFLSDLSDEENILRFKKIVLQSLNQIAYLACPLAILLLILRIPAVRLAFGTRNFSWELTVLVGRMVAIMAVSIPAQAMFHLLVRSFHALRDTVTPFIISVATTVVFFVGAALSIQMPENQLFGIAATISITAILETVLYMIFLNHKLKKLFDFNFLLTQGKIYIITFVTGVALYIPFKLLDNLVFNTSRVVPLLMLTFITAVVGLSVYILLSKLFKIEEMKIVANLFENLIHHNKKTVPKLVLPPTEIINDPPEN